MQERPDWERSAPAKPTGLNGTSKYRPISQGTGKYRAISTSTSEHRAIPQRPRNMPHVDENPEKRRVPRPEYQPKQPRRLRPRLLILVAIAAIIAIIGFVIISLLGSAINQSAGPATTAADFVISLSNQNYDNAYQDFGPAVTIRINKPDFMQQEQGLDQQYGTITEYSEDPGSAIVKNNTEMFTYTITRKNPSKSDQLTNHKLTITVYQDANNNNNWEISDYNES